MPKKKSPGAHPVAVRSNKQPYPILYHEKCDCTKRAYHERYESPDKNPGRHKR